MEKLHSELMYNVHSTTAMYVNEYASDFYANVFQVFCCFCCRRCSSLWGIAAAAAFIISHHHTRDEHRPV